MQAITKFKAKDGKEFSSESECSKYELLIDKTKSIMSRLSSPPKNFNNGEYIQHNKADLKIVKLEILKLISGYIDHAWVQQTIDNIDGTHPSYVGRLVGEYNIAPLSDAWGRIYCTDKEGREWNQPYFVENPPEQPKLVS